VEKRSFYENFSEIRQRAEIKILKCNRNQKSVPQAGRHIYF